MKLITTITTVMMVLGFLSSALGAFPLANIAAAKSIDATTPFSKDAVQQTANQVGAMYSSVIDDLASFAANPDLALAADHRDQMTSYAQDLANRFQGFANDLQVNLDQVTQAPQPPTGVTATAGNGQIVVDWDDNTEPDFNFYNVYRGTSVTGPFTLIAGGLADSTFIDAGVTTGTAYTYIVTAVNNSMIESAGSAPATATP